MTPSVDLEVADRDAREISPLELGPTPAVIDRNPQAELGPDEV